MLLVVAGALAPAGARASGATFCVPSKAIAGCPTSGKPKRTIAAAVSASANGDRVLIGPGTFSESVNDGGKSLTLLGEGIGKTIIQGQSSPSMTLSHGSRVSALSVNLPSGNGNTGLQLAGVAVRVAVTATLRGSASNDIGVDLVNGGQFVHGSVVLPVKASDASHSGGVIGSGTVSDSSIAAAVGVTSASSGNEDIPIVHRVRILANRGLLQAGADATIDDSLIRTVPGAASQIGIGMDPNAALWGRITARHVTLVGSGATGSVGVFALGAGTVGSGPTVVTIDSSIIRGYATPVDATAFSTPVIGPGSATVHVEYSNYDAGTSQTSNIGPGSNARIESSHSSYFDPLFAAPSAGDYALRAGSRAIDAGDPGPLASGESRTDLAGNPRVVAGRRGDRPRGDMGAYEFVPHKPVVHASASSQQVPVGVADTFHAAGSDASPGDRLTFQWRFDDGAFATGASVKHAFASPGMHRATVTARDLDGFTASATVSVNVQR